MQRIYLDHASTSPLLPSAREAMVPWLGQGFGNPSSLHAEGRSAKQAIDESREVFSNALGCLFGEVVFTSSGTEAVNLAILGTALANLHSGRNEILIGSADHHCALYTRQILQHLGIDVKLIPVDREAQVSVETVEEMVGDHTLLVSLIHANNEFGTINPVEEIGKVVKESGAIFHVDSVQTFPGEWGVHDLNADLVSISAHKFGGPKAVGALFINAGVDVTPIAVGGGQEREMRAGTENVAGIVGAGAALKEVLQDSETEITRSRARNVFEEKLDPRFKRSVVRAERLGGHSHLRSPGIDSEVFLIRLDRAGVSASSGAACSSGSLEPSHVMLAAGYSAEESRQGLRFTFGRNTTELEAVEAASRVNAALESILEK
ncbi:cysteine desulfurase family protein [Kamptonema cortianum]|nr:cysteine desulfurase family protein [Geitlerinema splendidum]MDK3157666.1 cysteine desulfurase family protein [Kamptonema cortianum]